MSNQLHIQLMLLEAIKIPEITLRNHSKAKVSKLAMHIARYGVLTPVLVDSVGQIVDGVARCEGAKIAGLDYIPVIDVSHVSPSELQAFRIALNRLQEEVKWKKETVSDTLSNLRDSGFDLDLTLLGTVKIKYYLEIGKTESKAEDLNASLAAPNGVAKPGDIWRMPSSKGEHRVACGDFSDEVLSQKLFGETKASACFTDPGYNRPRRGQVALTVKHSVPDLTSDGIGRTESEAILGSLLGMINRQLHPNGVAFVCADWRHTRDLLNAGASCNLELLNMAIWTKNNPGLGSFYRSQHEEIAVFNRKGQSPRSNLELGRKGRARSNVWSYPGVNMVGPDQHLLGEHPRIKPTSLVVDAICDVTRPGEIVFDPCLGTGPTLIAAERTQRCCYGIEMDPHYVDLAIRRWQLETGRNAVREGDNVSFADAEIMANRTSLLKAKVSP